MKVAIPILRQSFDGGKVVNEEKEELFDIDTSVYSEERWEQHFPAQAKQESLFEYIERVQHSKDVSDRVRVSAMLKAVYCFVESDTVPSYKQFAQLFVLSNPDYTERLINRLVSVFRAVSEGSAVKN